MKFFVVMHWQCNLYERANVEVFRNINYYAEATFGDTCICDCLSSI